MARLSHRRQSALVRVRSVLRLARRLSDVFDVFSLGCIRVAESRPQRKSEISGDRLLRLGAPFVFGVTVVAPIALYPAYRMIAVDPSLIAYGRRFLALPFWPNGPMWFLWLLLALTVAPAGLHRFAPHWVAFLGRLSSDAAARPGRYFIGLTTVAALAYVPLAIAFTPWNWSEHGPFSLQLSRPLLYAVYYLAGLGVGAHGLERGLLAPEGMLARRWSVWLHARSLRCCSGWGSPG